MGDKIEVSEELRNLRRQVKLLALGLSTLLIFTGVLALNSFRKQTVADWYDVSVDTLRVKHLMLISNEGRILGSMDLVEGGSALALRDSNGNIQLFAAALDDAGFVQTHRSADGKEQRTTVGGDQLNIGDDASGVDLKNDATEGPSVVLRNRSGSITTITGKK